MGQSRIKNRIPFVIGGSISVSCFPRGASPGLRGGVGSRWSREAVEWWTAVIEDVIEDASKLTLLDMVPPMVVLCTESASGMITGVLEGVLLLDTVLMTPVALAKKFVSCLVLVVVVIVIREVVEEGCGVC